MTEQDNISDSSIELEIVQCGNCAYCTYYETCGFNSRIVFDCTQFGIPDVDPVLSACTFGNLGNPVQVSSGVSIHSPEGIYETW